MNRTQIRSYAASIDPARFPYFCAVTGELAPSLRYVIHASVVDLFKYHIIHHWVRVPRHAVSHIRREVSE